MCKANPSWKGTASFSGQDSIQCKHDQYIFFLTTITLQPKLCAMCAMHLITAMYSCICLSMMLGDHEHLSSTHFGPIRELPDYSIENGQNNNSILKCWRSQFLSACCNIWKIWTALDCRGANSELIHIFELVSEKDRTTICLWFPSDWNVYHSVWTCLSSWFYECHHSKILFSFRLGAVPAKCCTHQAFSKGDRQVVLGIPGIGQEQD